jgi:hypothetical protein
MLAIQPASWGNLDEWGCLWAETMEEANRVAQSISEPAMIWKVGTAAAFPLTLHLPIR